MVQKDYPLYETTVFKDFRVMTENVAKKYPDRIAISYKKDPRDTNHRCDYTEARDYIRNIEQDVSMGCRASMLRSSESSYQWVCSYFNLMSIGSVVVPPDRDYRQRRFQILS